MWRRPLTDAEVNSLDGLYTTAAGQGDGPEGGLKTVVQALFLSPNFLYRSELGDTSRTAVTRLTDYELASALSYTLWDTAPDAELLELAQQGRCATRPCCSSRPSACWPACPRPAAAMHTSSSSGCTPRT